MTRSFRINIVASTLRESFDAHLYQQDWLGRNCKTRELLRTRDMDAEELLDFLYAARRVVREQSSGYRADLGGRRTGPGGGRPPAAAQVTE